MERAARPRQDGAARDRRPSQHRRACPTDVVTILDVKCPGSGEAERNDWKNLDRLRPHDEVKFVVKDRADYEYARDVIARHDLCRRAAAIHLSPVHGVLDPKTLSEWVLADSCPCACSCSSTSTSGVRDARCLMSRRAVVLLSGGLDSYTAAAMARADGFRLYALTVRYGQRHAKEIEAARAVAQRLGVEQAHRARRRSVRVRRLVADDRRAGAEGSAHRSARDSVHVRAGAQHGVPLARAWLGRGARRARHRHWRERARLLRAIPIAVRSSSRPSSTWRRWRRRAACTASAFAFMRRCR